MLEAETTVSPDFKLVGVHTPRCLDAWELEEALSGIINIQDQCYCSYSMNRRRSGSADMI